MATRVTDLVAEVTADTRKFDRSITEAERTLDKIRRARHVAELGLDTSDVQSGTTSARRSLANITGTAELGLDSSDVESGSTVAGSMLNDVSGTAELGLDSSDVEGGATVAGTMLNDVSGTAELGLDASDVEGGATAAGSMLNDISGVATLTLDASDVESRLADLQGQMDGMRVPAGGGAGGGGGALGAGAAGGLAGRLGGMGGGILAGGAALLGGGAALKGWMQEGRDAIRTADQLRNTIETMGAGSWITAEAVEGMATRIQETTGASDEWTTAGANMLLTFANVRNEVGAGNDIFNQSTGLMADMATFMGSDTVSAATMMGKALNDPIKGMSAMSRVGVSFTEDEAEMIKTMTEAGDTIGAQKVLLGALESQFGGTAAAVATDSDRAQARIGDLTESIGVQLAGAADWAMPRVADFAEGVVSVFGDVVGWVRANWPAIQDGIGSAFDWVRANVLPVVAVIAGFVVEKFGQVVAWVREIWPQVSEAIGHVMTVTGAIIRGAIDVISTWWRAWGDDLWNMVRTTWDAIYGVVSSVIKVVQGIIQTVLAVINGDWGKAWDGIKKVLAGVWDAIVAIVRGAINLVGSIIGGSISMIQEVWRGAWDRIKDYLYTSWELMKRTVTGAVGAVVDFFRGLPGRITGAIGDLGGAIYGFVLNQMKHFLGAAVVRFAEVFDYMSNLPGKIVGAIGDLGGVLVEKGKELVKGLISGITDAPRAVANAIGGLFAGDGPGGPMAPRAGGRISKTPTGRVAGRGGKAVARVRAILPHYPGTRITSTYRTPAQNRRAGGSPTSFHMDKANPAVDIGGPIYQLDRLAGALGNDWREKLWRVKGHFDHIHVAHEGGVVANSWGTLPGLRFDERPVIAQVGETILPRRASATMTPNDGGGVHLHFHDLVITDDAGIRKLSDKLETVMAGRRYRAGV